MSSLHHFLTQQRIIDQSSNFPTPTALTPFFCHLIFLPSHFSAFSFFCHRIFLPFLFLPISDSENEEGQRFFAGLLAGGPWRRGTLADSPTHSLKLYREAPPTGN